MRPAPFISLVLDVCIPMQGDDNSAMSSESTDQQSSSTYRMNFEEENPQLYSYPPPATLSYPRPPSPVRHLDPQPSTQFVYEQPAHQPAVHALHNQQQNIQLLPPVTSHDQQAHQPPGRRPVASTSTSRRRRPNNDDGQQQHQSYRAKTQYVAPEVYDEVRIFVQ
jgi:hypothetical protein